MTRQIHRQATQVHWQILLRRWITVGIKMWPFLSHPLPQTHTHTHMLTMTNSLWRASVNMARKGPLLLPRADEAVESASGRDTVWLLTGSEFNFQWIISPFWQRSGKTCEITTVAFPFLPVCSCQVTAIQLLQFIVFKWPRALHIAWLSVLNVQQKQRVKGCTTGRCETRQPAINCGVKEEKEDRKIYMTVSQCGRGLECEILIAKAKQFLSPGVIKCNLFSRTG